jgi:integrase
MTIGRWNSPWSLEKARQQAKVILYQSHVGIDAGKEKERSRLRGTTLSEMLDEYLLHVKRKKKLATYQNYEQAIRLRIKPRLGSKIVRELTEADIEDLHSHLCKMPRMANLTVAVLSAALTWGKRKGYADTGRAICIGVERYREVERKRYLTSDEARRLGEVMQKSEAEGLESTHSIALLWLIVFTGARRDEIRTLKWSYVDQERRCLRLPDSKTGPKTIVLNSFAWKILSNVPRVGQNPYVFVGVKDNQPLNNIYKPWHRIRKEAGLGDVRIHDLRHTFGLKAVDAGGATRVIMELLGHKTESMSRRYTHVSDARTLELSEATGRLIATTMLPKSVDSFRARLRRRRLRVRREGGTGGNGLIPIEAGTT